jgi:hypothetical protein
MSSWARETEKEKRPAISGRTDIEDRQGSTIIDLESVGSRQAGRKSNETGGKYSGLPDRPRSR